MTGRISIAAIVGIIRLSIATPPTTPARAFYRNDTIWCRFCRAHFYLLPKSTHIPP
jgi:hypothetical protein